MRRFLSLLLLLSFLAAGGCASLFGEPSPPPVPEPAAEPEGESPRRRPEPSQPPPADPTPAGPGGADAPEAEPREEDPDPVAAPRGEAPDAGRDGAGTDAYAGVEILPGAVLPRERVVAFYGNPRSDRMGILGELPPDELLARLDEEVRAWERADPGTPVRPALHLIAVMATADPGPDSTWTLRMPSSVIRDVLGWAERRDALVFLDIQPGRGDVVEEARRLLPWLERPNVHLALDPEWNMPEGALPGRVIGTMDASEINSVQGMLAELVAERGLPPKILVVHRFTRRMVTNVEEVRIDPRVQVVLHMDGWGRPENKIATYMAHVAHEPIPFTGFKIFYRNDLRDGSRLMTPEEVLALVPEPVYIQYQ